jgi:hypothetical protein
VEEEEEREPKAVAIEMEETVVSVEGETGGTCDNDLPPTPDKACEENTCGLLFSGI